MAQKRNPISLKVLRGELVEWYEAFIRFAPGRAGDVLRRSWLKRRLMRGDELRVGSGCEFFSPRTICFDGVVSVGKNSFFSADGGYISVGDGTAFNMKVHINASVGGTIRIGRLCLIGPNVVMRTANHRYDDPDRFIRHQGHVVGDIDIEDDVWVGANALILGGIHIGRGAVVGAGAVVTRNVPAMSVVAGVPARVISFRDRGEA